MQHIPMWLKEFQYYFPGFLCGMFFLDKLEEWDAFENIG